MACICRVNLDAFWSRAKGILLGNRDKLADGLQLSKTVGLGGPYEVDGPLPKWDHCGYEVAIQMVLSSWRKGRYCVDHLQFDTIWKLRSCYLDQCRAAASANCSAISLGDEKGKYGCFSTDVCASFWFYSFLEGCKHRMGQDWRPNQAMRIRLLLRVLEEID
jgi:hypothetical protein